MVKFKSNSPGRRDYPKPSDLGLGVPNSNDDLGWEVLTLKVSIVDLT